MKTAILTTIAILWVIIAISWAVYTTEWIFLMYILLMVALYAHQVLDTILAEEFFQINFNSTAPGIIKLSKHIKRVQHLFMRISVLASFSFGLLCYLLLTQQYLLAVMIAFPFAMFLMNIHFTREKLGLLKDLNRTLKEEYEIAIKLAELNHTYNPKSITS